MKRLSVVVLALLFGIGVSTLACGGGSTPFSDAAAPATMEGATPAPTAAQEPLLYDRLGGLAPPSVVVSDFLDAVVSDPTLNQNPALSASRTRVPTTYLKYHVTAMVCQATGGPCQYHGRDMIETHADLGITQAEWDRMVVLFKEVLAKHNVPEAETQELLTIVGSTMGDIVTSGQ